MTESGARLGYGIESPLSVAGLVDASLQPGGGISLAFSDGVVHVMLDQTGDWTITAGLSVVSGRLLRLTRSLEELGFFRAAEEDGMVYHLWTSALHQDGDNRGVAEETLLKVLKSFHESFTPSYIG